MRQNTLGSRIAGHREQSETEEMSELEHQLYNALQALALAAEQSDSASTSSGLAKAIAAANQVLAVHNPAGSNAPLTGADGQPVVAASEQRLNALFEAKDVAYAIRQQVQVAMGSAASRLSENMQKLEEMARGLDNHLDAAIRK